MPQVGPEAGIEGGCPGQPAVILGQLRLGLREARDRSRIAEVERFPHDHLGPGGVRRADHAPRADTGDQGEQDGDREDPPVPDR